jgi:hypothetical protein
MEVHNIHDTDFLRDKVNKSCIDALFKLPLKIKLLENIYNISLMTSQQVWKNAMEKTIKVWGLITLKCSHHHKNLTLLKSSFQP